MRSVCCKGFELVMRTSRCVWGLSIPSVEQLESHGGTNVVKATKKMSSCSEDIFVVVPGNHPSVSSDSYRELETCQLH
jgi:hypothetical protein